jgi:hypothetical protein
MFSSISRRVCFGLHHGLGLISVLTVLPVAAVGYSATLRNSQVALESSNDCAYRVVSMASGQPGADPITVHRCFAPTSFMGSKSDEEFQTAVRPLIPSQPRQFEYVGAVSETRPDGTQGKIEIYVVHDPYPSSVYAFHMDQQGLIANVGAN